jgi:glucose-6-phosphate isomerase
VALTTTYQSTYVPSLSSSSLQSIITNTTQSSTPNNDASAGISSVKLLSLTSRPPRLVQSHRSASLPSPNATTTDDNVNRPSMSGPTTASHSTIGKNYKIVLDYSRQCVLGETMELLFDLADAMGLTDRRDMFQRGQEMYQKCDAHSTAHHVAAVAVAATTTTLPSSSSSIISAGDGTTMLNVIETATPLPVLHHVLRMPHDFHHLLDMPLLARQQKRQQQKQQFLLHHHHHQHHQSSSLHQHHPTTTQAPRDNEQSTIADNNSNHDENSNPHHVPVSDRNQHDVIEHVTLSDDDNRNVNNLDPLSTVEMLRNRVRVAAENVRCGNYRSVTGDLFENVIVVANGATSLGINCVAETLGCVDNRAIEASQHRSLRFLSNIDPTDAVRVTANIDPAVTLVIVACDTFTDPEVILNTRTLQDWLVHNLKHNEFNSRAHDTHEQHPVAGSHDTKNHGDSMNDDFASARRSKSLTPEDVYAQHVWVITTESGLPACQELGIQSNNIFRWLDWIDSRHSVSSVVGLLPLSIHYSYAVMEDFLYGAHAMDEHFFTAPLRDNIPVILGLLGVWNSTFLGLTSRAIIPYSRGLNMLPTLVQHIDAGNAKRVALDGSHIWSIAPSGKSCAS